MNKIKRNGKLVSTGPLRFSGILVVCIILFSLEKVYADIWTNLAEYGGKKLIDKAIDGDGKVQEAQVNRTVSMSTAQIQTSIKSAVVLLGYKEAESLTRAFADFEVSDVNEAREKAMHFFTTNVAISDIKHIHALVEKMHTSVQSIGLTGGQMVKFQEFTIFLHETGQASFLPRISNATAEIFPQKKVLAMILSGKASRFRNGKIKMQITILDESDLPLDAKPGFESGGKLGRVFTVNASGRLFKINQKFAIPLSFLSESPEAVKGFRAKVSWSSPENNILIEEMTEHFFVYKDEVSNFPPQTDVAVPTKIAEGSKKKMFAWSIWGGYNFVGKSDYIKTAENTYEGNSFIKNKVNNTTLGGVAAGVDFLYGARFQGGVSAGYFPGHRFEKTFSDTLNNKYAATAQMDFIPLLIVAKAYLLSGLYMGVGLGVAPAMRGKESISRNGFLYSSSPSVPSEISQNVFAWTFQGRLGLDLPLGENFSIGIMGAFTYLTMLLDQSFLVNSAGSVYVGSQRYSTWMLTPSLVFSFKW